MTENEEIKKVINGLNFLKEKLYNGIYADRLDCIDYAISAFKEIQQYREIGTVEECREAVEKLKRAEVALSVILSGNYNDECNFCVHNDNPMANCQCISGDGSWCKHNAKWNGEISDNKNLEGIEVE